MSSSFQRNFSDRSRARLVGSAFKSLLDLISVEGVSPPTFALFLSACEVDHLTSSKGTSSKNVVMDRLNLEGSSVIFHVCIIPKVWVNVKNFLELFLFFVEGGLGSVALAISIVAKDESENE